MSKKTASNTVGLLSVIGGVIALLANISEIIQVFQKSTPEKSESSVSVVDTFEKETEVFKETITEQSAVEISEITEEIQPPVPETKRINKTSDAVRNIVCSSQLDDVISYGIIHNYNGWNLVDNNVNTCWSEGVSGRGEGEEIYIELNDTYSVDNITIYNGLQASRELFYKNARVKELYFEFSNGENFIYELNGEWEDSINEIYLPNTIETNYIKLEIYSAFSGNKYNDTCISEIIIR